MAKITLYEDKNLGGTAHTFTDEVSNLKNYNFGDETSSIQVSEGKWILYKDQDFQGDNTIVSVGKYLNPSEMKIGGDEISSLRPLPSSGIALFKDDNYKGRMLALTSACDNFKNVDFNDEVSSIMVVSGTWNLYEDTGFSGTPWTLSPGNYTKGDAVFQNDEISSARPV